MWRFETKRFAVVWSVTQSEDPDLSWADQETIDNLSSGLWTCFDSRVQVLLDGVAIGSDYLGESIYENPSNFRDKDSYFRDMVTAACKEARDHVAKCDLPRMRTIA